MVFEHNISREEINLHLCICVKSVWTWELNALFSNSKNRENMGICKKMSENA